MTYTAKKKSSSKASKGPTEEQAAILERLTALRRSTDDQPHPGTLERFQSVDPAFIESGFRQHRRTVSRDDASKFAEADPARLEDLAFSDIDSAVEVAAETPDLVRHVHLYKNFSTKDIARALELPALRTLRISKDPDDEIDLSVLRGAKLDAL